MDIKDRVIKCKSMIETACIETGLNLTIYEGKIAFVDQDNEKIVALWSAEHTLSEVNND